MTEARRTDQMIRSLPGWITACLPMILFILGALPYAANAEHTPREIRFKGRPNNDNTQQTCHIRFTGKYGQCEKGVCSFLPLELRKKLGQDLNLGMDCLDVKDIKLLQGFNVRFDPDKKIWKKDFSHRTYVTNKETFETLNKASRVYQVQAVNSSGFVYTEDDLMGYPSQRQRLMQFCLFHPPRALCGNAPVMQLNRPRENLLPYVFEVLGGIEFIDDLASPTPIE